MTLYPRRGMIRPISDLPLAGSVTPSDLVEIEQGVGDMRKVTVNDLVSANVRAILEEAPTVPSPYDDEFNAAAIDPKWTQTSGSASDLSILYSRALSITSTAFLLRQTMALTNPLRVVCGIAGNNNGAAYNGVQVILQGVTKGISFGVDGGISANKRRIHALRLSAAGAYETDLNVQEVTADIGTSGSAASLQQLTLLIDATNVTCFYGELGCASNVWYSYPRVNLGTLASFSVGAGLGFSVRWFRVDRATTQAAFPLDWAG